MDFIFWGKIRKIHSQNNNNNLFAFISPRTYQDKRHHSSGFENVGRTEIGL